MYWDLRRQDQQKNKLWGGGRTPEADNAQHEGNRSVLSRQVPWSCAAYSSKPHFYVKSRNLLLLFFFF